jgi:DNA topoisomerase I
MATGQDIAREMRLRYVTDSDPGIARRRYGKGFAYYDPDGNRITDAKTLERIKSLVIPPAYKKVWICLSPNGHLQATGIDDRGRKQYRYHPKWRSTRDENKFGNLRAFGEKLPVIREHIAGDLRKRNLSREKVLATAVSLLESTHIRVGNAEYARDNKSFGLTTLRKKHMTLDEGGLRLEFTGKSGKKWSLDVRDRRIIRTIRACSDLPGHELFQYRDENGERRCISSQDVNAYLKEITGADFTAKDFRTWSGTVMAVEFLLALEPCETQTQRKKNVTQVIKAVADRLKNTPAVCRSSYVHPRVIEHYMASDLPPLSRDVEAYVLDLLKAG